MTFRFQGGRRDGGKVCSDRMESEEEGLDQLGNDLYAGASVFNSNSNQDRAAIILEFSIDVALFKDVLRGELPEWSGYLWGHLGLYVSVCR